MSKTLGQRIQTHRTALGLSQEALGAQLGVSRQAISKWEADGSVPDTDKLIALSRLFGISLNALLQVQEPTEAPSETPPEKGRSRRHWGLPLLALILILGILLCGITCFKLGQRIDALEEEAQPLFSHYSFAVEPTGGEHNSAIYSIDLAAAKDLGDAGVTILLTDNWGQTSQREAAPTAEPGHYSARLSHSIDAADTLTISALVQRGGKTRTVPLVELTDILIGDGSRGYDSHDLLNR